MQSNFSLSDIEEIINKAKEDILAQFRDEISKISSSLNSLSKKVEKIDDRMTGLEDRNREHHNQIESIQTTLKEVQKRDEFNLQEMESRLNRMTNVIISGIPELSSGSVDERSSHDEEKLKKILQEVGNKSTQNFKITRIGRPRTDRPRLLKVICPDINTKRQILRDCKTLRKSTDSKNIFINEDLTQMQQKQSNALRVELRQRRERGEDVVIYRNQIVKRSEIKNFHKRF